MIVEIILKKLKGPISEEEEILLRRQERRDGAQHRVCYSGHEAIGGVTELKSKTRQ